MIPLRFGAALLLLYGLAGAQGPGTKIAVPLSFPHAGLASAGVYNAKGELIRSLAYARTVKGGKEQLEWDGTTDLGLPAPAGTYHVKAVEFTSPPSIRYVMKAGISGDPPYLTPEPSSGWGAVHGPAEAACANETNIALAFETAESVRETGIQWMDRNGKIIRWFSTPFPFDSRLACAMDAKHLYVALQVSWRPPNRLVIMRYDLDSTNNGVTAGKILCDIPVGDHIIPGGRWVGRWQVVVEGMALRDGRLYVPLKLDDKVVQVDTSSGQIVATAAIPSPGGIATYDKTTYVVSGTKVIALAQDGSAGAAVVTGLEDPHGLASDEKGLLYVADRGASQQVKVFDQHGKLVQTLGIKGGRPRDGIFNPNGMLDPRGVAVASDGRVWVTEIADDFEVVLLWNPNGSVAHSFFNMHWSSGQGRLSPDRKELFFGARVQEVESGLNSYKVDLAHGTWTPYWHLSQPLEAMDQRDVLLGYVPSTDREKATFRGHAAYLSFEKDMIQAVNGKTYLVGGDMSIYLFDPVTKKAKLASLLYLHHVEKTAEGPYKAFYDQGSSNWLSWADLNGDGRMSLDETNVTTGLQLLEHVPKIQSVQLMPDLSVMMLLGVTSKSVYVPHQWLVCRLRPQKVLESGVPVYDWHSLERVTELHVPDFAGGDRDPEREVTRVQLDFMRVVDNALYVRLEPGAKVRRHFSGIDGDGWWASRNWRIAPEKFDLATGDPAWLKLGRRAPGHAKPGEMYYPGWGLAGTSHGVDFFADTLSQVWAWTDDGLYLGPVYNDNTKTNHYDNNSVFVELIGAYVYDIEAKTYILAGDHGIMVHEMTFPRMTRVDGGSIRLTASESAAARPWDPDGPPPGKKPSYIARSIFNFDKDAQKNTRTITVDGRLDPAEWSGVPKMSIKDEGEEIGTVQVTFDKTNLYLAYTIRDRNGPKNDGHELPLAPFATGSYVDFDLGPDWGSPQRDENAEADVRVILAKIVSGQNYQMGFWPVKQDIRRYQRGARLHPEDIVSPAQRRHFDDVEPVPGLEEAYGAVPGGYTVEVSIPLTSLGLNTGKQPEVGFDASIGFSDAAGQVRTRALHWAGETESAVVDRPGSAELRPRTWGTLLFDRNPLPPIP